MSPVLADQLRLEDHWEMQLERRLRGRIRNLKLEVRPEGVVLQGLASTYHAKQLAQHAAMEVVRQPILANEIKVA